ncbi:hypothetical protein, partial [Citrobacter braakii]|uniref:hypothetical protein n=1 Tax=Citrobacter braakii TaxID=57706 RepID=UPI0037AE797C
IHKRIVFGMDNQRGFGDLVEQRHSATLTVIVYSIGETVDFGGTVRRPEMWLESRIPDWLTTYLEASS